ncbi:MAG: deoxyribose-phosphate aldolase [Myxococcales bacterium]|nr:deoxyribose-phosphate aldolase [Myxococcales bacterium]|tara:strand:+ start:1137 stop:1895 length:759 start_codon:yes stop_codon:yes gene_type:complete
MPEDTNECGMCAVERPDGTYGAGHIGHVGELTGEIAGYIDHTLLKPEATKDQLFKLAEEARKHQFATVCVNSVNVHMMARFLNGSGVPVCAVVGFPLGAMSPRSKAYETREAIRCGAGEIDMVINIGALKSGDYELALRDIKAVVEAAKPIGVKVILETNKLDHNEKVIACALSKAAGAAFVKTSTGFGGGGATVEDVTLMRDLVGTEMGVKASGGVRSKEDVNAMIRAGANRIGASASVAIVTGGKATGNY